MTGSTYAPARWEDIAVANVSPSVIGVQESVTAGTTVDLDTLVADDSLIRGIELMAKNATFGDTVSISIIDIDGVYAPPNTVLAMPVTDFVIVAAQEKQADYESVAPFKLLGGLYIRITYTSTAGTGDPVLVGANLLLVKVLV